MGPDFKLHSTRDELHRHYWLYVWTYS